MRTVYSGILKKIADAGGRIDRETGAKQAAKPKATKKRKNDGDDDNAADSQATPKPAKTPRKQKEKAVLSDECKKASLSWS